MQLKGIPPIHSAEKVAEIAFRRASKEAARTQGRTREIRRKKGEAKRVKEASKYILTYLTGVEKLRLSIDEASAFHHKLLDILIGLERIDAALQKIGNSKKSIQRLERRIIKGIRRSNADPVVMRKKFYGSAASLLRRIEPEFVLLGEAIQAIKGFPTIKEGFTVVIAGMPNVGKSSLLRVLTSSTPQVKPYPFTTKGILVGYMGEMHRQIQMIDTPGILDRPIEDRNPIERQAALAVQELADLIVFIFDPTGTCGYTLDSQIDLFQELEKSFDGMIAVSNKTDIADEKDISHLEGAIGVKTIPCSATTGVFSEVKDVIYGSSKKKEKSGSSIGE